MKKLALLLGLVSVLSAMVGRSVWADDCSLSVEAGDTLAYNDHNVGSGVLRIGHSDFDTYRKDGG